MEIEVPENKLIVGPIRPEGHFSTKSKCLSENSKFIHNLGFQNYKIFIYRFSYLLGDVKKKLCLFCFNRVPNGLIVWHFFLFFSVIDK